MLRTLDIPLAIFALCLSSSLSLSQEAPLPEPAPDFAELVTTSGKSYRNVFVTKVEADAILIRHADGLSRVSLFDVSEEIQVRYHFDPVEGMKTYRKNLAENRERQKELFLAGEKQRAEAIRRAAEEELLALAKREWVPVVAVILNIEETGAKVRAKRIVFVPTKVRSALGFLNDGPPEIQYENFSEKPVFLKMDPSKLKSGMKWKGYLNPIPDRFVVDPATGLPTIPAHAGVSAP
jgi:hypothetical protein